MFDRADVESNKPSTLSRFVPGMTLRE